MFKKIRFLPLYKCIMHDNLYSFLEHFYFYVYQCFVCMHVCVPLAWLLSLKARRGFWIPGIEVIDSCKLTCECWTSNLGSLQECQGLVMAEPPFQNRIWILK